MCGLCLYLNSKMLHWGLSSGFSQWHTYYESISLIATPPAGHHVNTKASRETLVWSAVHLWKWNQTFIKYNGNQLGSVNSNNSLLDDCQLQPWSEWTSCRRKGLSCGSTWGRQSRSRQKSSLCPAQSENRKCPMQKRCPGGKQKPWAFGPLVDSVRHKKNMYSAIKHDTCTSCWLVLPESTVCIMLCRGSAFPVLTHQYYVALKYSVGKR